jgi:para-nitrobenzyl esterase|tara:strand:+ start:8091 stop:9389 length:1299 start_codon:yes stop_codon:yes gene_type:complete
MAASGSRDEDCLYLNVFTPAADARARAVLFWIHGGGFQLGSGSELLYNGGPLAERGDLVVVTIHYRLGALGYAYFGPAGDSWGATPNNGQLDQIEALKWVRENITSFGGDPDNITIFGESAGASAIATLLAMPAGRGLFSKAILQSGCGARTRSADSCIALTERLLHELSLDSGDLAAISKLPVDQIVQAQQAVSSGENGMGGFGPVQDGVILPDMPLQAVNEGSAADTPVLMGTNRDEAKLFNAVPNRPPLDDDQLREQVGQMLKSDAATTNRIIQLFADSRAAHQLPASNHDVVDIIQTMVGFRVPGNRFAECLSRHQPKTFLYLFSWESPARRGDLGACHALDMPFVFGTLDAPTQDRFAGKGLDAENLARNMMDAWIAFAGCADPSHPGIGNWEPFERHKRNTMIFGGECLLTEDPFAEERLAIEKLV